MRNKIGLCLTFLPLLLGADVARDQLGLSIDSACGADQYLVFSGGNLVCKSISAGPAQGSLPNCSAKSQLLTKGSGELASLACTPPGQSVLTSTDVMNVTNLETKLTTLGNTIQGLPNSSGSSLSLFVGTTDTPTKGKITFTGVDNGVPAANAQCNAKFAGSHMCSVYDMYNSVVDGHILKTGFNSTKAWVYMAGWNYPSGTPTPNSNTTSAGGPQEGTSDNCGSQTYPTGDRKWTGTAVEYTKLQTGDYGLKFHGGPSSGTAGTVDYIDGAPCNKSYVIACCK